MNVVIKLFGLLLLGTVLFSPYLAQAQHYAEVLEVEPVYGTRTYYEDVQVEYFDCEPERGRGLVQRGTNSLFGSLEGLLGTAVGVAIGSQIGGGSGTDAAMVVGGLIGNSVGNDNRSEECRSRFANRRQPYTEQYVREYKYIVLLDGNVYQNIRRDTYVPVGEEIAVEVRVR